MMDLIFYTYKKRIFFFNNDFYPVPKPSRTTDCQGIRPVMTI